MPTDRQRDDLAALLARAARRFGAAEQPVLDEHGITMWEYIVLSALASGSAPNQLALARETGYDKSRLILLLDGLEDRNLVERVRDPADRRSHLVSITEAGRRLHVSARSAIRAMEDDVLSALTSAEKRSLLAALPKLNDELKDRN